MDGHLGRIDELRSANGPPAYVRGIYRRNTAISLTHLLYGEQRPRTQVLIPCDNGLFTSFRVASGNLDRLLPCDFRGREPMFADLVPPRPNSSLDDFLLLAWGIKLIRYSITCKWLFNSSV